MHALALMIDAERRTVTEITTTGDWDAIRDLLNTNWIAIASPALVSYSDGGADVVFYDDYQCEAGEDPEAGIRSTLTFIRGCHRRAPAVRW